MLSQLRFKLCGKISVGVIFYLVEFSIISDKIGVLGAEVGPPSLKMFVLPQDIEPIQSQLESLITQQIL